MTAKDKAFELALKFCTPLDFVKPNKRSILNAIKCCEEIININELTVEERLKWNDVIVELNKL